ncbi:MAG: hypothetical protein AAB799_00540 [Patescibacteria group bacterium]
MKIKKPPGIFIVFLAVFLVVVVFKSGYAQDLASKKIDIEMTAMPQISEPPPLVTWNIIDKLAEKDDELARTSVSLGVTEKVYYENRISIRSDGTKSVTRKKLSDKERVLGLKLINTETGEVQVIKVETKITVSGVTVKAPEGYQIETVERPNGIKWNYWNTLYRVTAPENTVVIENFFPREVRETISRVVKGKVRKEIKKVVRGFSYVPHSEFFEGGENEAILVEAGKNRDKSVVAEALANLRERGVMSRSFPGTLVADVKALNPRFFERLPLLEQGDLTEFTLDPEKTVKRTLIILGANGEIAWKYTCNRSDACGWIQFTPRTYRSLRVTFPAAKLIVDFKEGAGNQVNSMMAAILLFDYNLKDLVDKYGVKIAEDPLLGEYLAASYNGAPKWVHHSLTATISKGILDWVTALSPTRKDSRGGLRNETRGFIAKWRYLAENDLP